MAATPTRVVLAVTDEFGNLRPFATGAIQLSLTGPGEIVGENPFSLSGGAGAVWVKAKEAAGTIRLEARHQYLASRRWRFACGARSRSTREAGMPSTRVRDSLGPYKELS